MTYDEFIATYKPGINDTVASCNCGSCDCPGWKLITPLDRKISEAMDRLPEVISKTAYSFGYELAMQREMAYVNTLLGKKACPS